MYEIMVIDVMLTILSTHQSVTLNTSRIQYMMNTMIGACVIRPLSIVNEVSLCANACFLVGLNILLSKVIRFIIYCVQKCAIVCNYIRIYVFQRTIEYFMIA